MIDCNAVRIAIGTPKWANYLVLYLKERFVIIILIRIKRILLPLQCPKLWSLDHQSKKAEVFHWAMHSRLSLENVLRPKWLHGLRYLTYCIHESSCQQLEYILLMNSLSNSQNCTKYIHAHARRTPFILYFTDTTAFKLISLWEDNNWTDENNGEVLDSLIRVQY